MPKVHFLILCTGNYLLVLLRTVFGRFAHVQSNAFAFHTAHSLILSAQAVKSVASSNSEPAATSAVSPPQPAARLSVIPQRLRTTSPPDSTSEPSTTVFGGSIPTDPAASALWRSGVQHPATVWSEKGRIYFSLFRATCLAAHSQKDKKSLCQAGIYPSV